MTVQQFERDTGAATLFAGPGEMRALCRAMDWSSGPLGPVESWPQSLRTAVDITMSSAFPTIVLWGPELVQTYNDGYREVMGAKHPSGLGQPTHECWPEVRDINVPIYARVLGGESIFVEDGAFSLMRRGVLEQTYFTLSYAPLRDEAGAVAGMIVTLFKTTPQVAARDLGVDRERLVRALDIERARLAQVFQQAPSFLAVMRGPDHVFELVNDAYRRLVGDRPLVGRPVFEAIPESRGQGFEEILDRVLNTGEPFIGRETRILLSRATGAPLEEVFLDFTYAPLLEADGTRTGVIAHGSDVTLQVRARREVERLLQESEASRAALRASEARLRDVLEQAPLAVAVLTGRDHVYSIVSPRYAQFLPGRRLLGRPVAEAIPELHGQWLLSILDRVYETGEPYFATEQEVKLDRDGDGMPEAYIYNIGYQPLRDATGCVYALVSAAVDVTPQVEARRELELARAAAEVARADAEQANRAKADFLATMSHELRTPLNAIGGYAELLELGVHGPITAAQCDALTRIQTSQRHLLGLINEVLNYTRLEAGVVNYTLETVHLVDAIAACEALVRPQMQAREIVFRSEWAAALAVRADREKLQQILLNLLSNAVKFTDASGSITVRCTPDHERVVIEVIDTGCGIPADRLESVFEPFVQIDARLTRRHEGVGLGLAISRDLARGMGGELAATSTEGVGSTFRLVVPRAA